MSETVLSALCSICHAQPPKYKCPRCGTRTCSVPCIQKHKSRADCDGVRNPGAFMPISQLKTAFGVDHDFNFLSSIERARQRSERDLVEVRQLLSEKELRPQNEERAFQKVWYGDELHHLPVEAPPHPKHGHGRQQDGPSFIDGFDKHVRRRLRYLDIETITMPKGMARQKENKTAFNRRTQTINWQVEWLVYGDLPLSSLPPQPQQQQPLRILHKSLEGKPLYAALASALDWHHGQQDRQSREQQQQSDNEADPSSPKKKRKLHHHNNKKKPPQELSPLTQDSTTTAWPAAPSTIQSTLTGAWNQTPGAEPTLEESLAAWQFFLVKATPHKDANNTNKGNTKTLIPVSPTDTLTTTLSGRTVIEFPTFYVLPPNWTADGEETGSRLPEGWVLGDGNGRREKKVRNGDGNESPKGNASMGRKRPFENTEEGSNPARGGKFRNNSSGRGASSAGHARAGKRGRFEVRQRGGMPPAAAPTVAAPGKMDVEEAEEGEIGSDDEGEVFEGRNTYPDVAVMDVDDVDVDADYRARKEGSGAGSGMRAWAGQEQQQQRVKSLGLGGGGGGGGLVNYGSSDDED